LYRVVEADGIFQALLNSPILTIGVLHGHFLGLGIDRVGFDLDLQIRSGKFAENEFTDCQRTPRVIFIGFSLAMNPAGGQTGRYGLRRTPGWGENAEDLLFSCARGTAAGLAAIFFSGVFLKNENTMGDKNAKLFCVGSTL